MTISKGNRIRDVSEECPHCYSFEVEGDMVDSGNEVGREMSCNNCYAEWYIEYEPMNWDTVSKPINPIPDPKRHVVNLRTTSHFVTSSGGN